MPKKTTEKKMIITEYLCDECETLVVEKNTCCICGKILCKNHMGNYFSVLENYEHDPPMDSDMRTIAYICEPCQKDEIKAIIGEIKQYVTEIEILESKYLDQRCDNDKKVNSLHYELLNYLKNNQAKTGD